MPTQSWFQRGLDSHYVYAGSESENEIALNVVGVSFVVKGNKSNNSILEISLKGKQVWLLVLLKHI